MKEKSEIKNPKSELDLHLTLDYGSGGRKMHRLIRELFYKYFQNPILAKFEDSAELKLQTNQPDFCYTIDSYVVQPLFFPGGDIGKLSICGTINDLAVKGAKPLYIAISFVIQEGLSIKTLEQICLSIAKASQAVNVPLVTGDTKIIEKRTNSEEIIITTCGIGKILTHFQNPTLGAQNIKLNDAVIINGSIGEHEASIILARGEYDFKANVKSDCVSLYPLIETLAQNKCKIKMMRDPTRGGLATTLNEIADASNLGIVIDEKSIPIQKSVRGICEILGFDPLYLANEGKVVIVADTKDSQRILKIMRKHPLGKNSALIGKVTERKYGIGVWLNTKIGSQRPVLQLEGHQIPRIC
ncbi:MAG: hydrogenase expression/formation protein HypE [candidate division WOR-3 bacterium]|nr:hydrogenase expression/formation protein HypE [candidate division WOR-3 bacterium]